MPTSFLDNKYVKGVGYVADAIARILIDHDFQKAYDLALKAVSSFGGGNVVKKMATDLHAMESKGDLPE